MLKVGQVYKQLGKPFWREQESDIFVITWIGYTIHLIDTDGLTFDMAGNRWIEGDCELIAEYSTWQEAINSKEFKK